MHAIISEFTVLMHLWKIKLLGIDINLYEKDKTFENFSKKGKEYLKLIGIQGFNL